MKKPQPWFNSAFNEPITISVVDDYETLREAGLQ
jgi:hypothetical protein